MSMEPCPTCGHVNVHSVDSCPRCGAPLTQAGSQALVKKLVLWMLVSDIPIVLGLVAYFALQMDLLVMLGSFAVSAVLAIMGVFKYLIRHKQALARLKGPQK